MKEQEEQREEVSAKKSSKLIALKDFKFSDGKNVYDIKKGDSIDVPKKYLPNLKTEKVIK